MGQSFVEWVWQGLRNVLGSWSTKSRSEKERKIGTFLLISQAGWLFIPFGPVRIMLHVGQLLLGFVLTLHGDYLKSSELDEKERKWRASVERQHREELKKLREMIIKQIAETNEISLEEAAKKADESEWIDSEGKTVPPLWMREAGEEEEG